ncbi:MAG: hypothetical protein HC835_20055 [Oscillatoriales cyanobacterium RM2_1_1]|nr:hypothetical protein [Oscillatoriales cyanobacterium SM2_3_0]NJO47703.1 hypothetical protein [Oscillatoriales cyanobacterium RM2_1_1]
MNDLKLIIYLVSSVALFLGGAPDVLAQELLGEVSRRSDGFLDISLQKQPKSSTDSRHFSDGWAREMLPETLPETKSIETLPNESPEISPEHNSLPFSDTESSTFSIRAIDLIKDPDPGQSLTQSLNTAQTSEEKLPLEEAPTEEVEDEDPRKAADESGRRLSNNYSYFALGGNAGFTGDGSGLSELAFSTSSKAGLSENFSIHSAGVLFTGRGASLIALTYGFPVRRETGSVILSPFLGGGIIYRDLFNEDFSVGGLIMGGIDLPISYSFVLTSRINVGFIRDSTDTSISIGIGYIYTKGLLGLIFD